MGFLNPKVKCPICGREDSLRNFADAGLVIGKDEEGYIPVKCRCQRVLRYSPISRKVVGYIDQKDAFRISSKSDHEEKESAEEFEKEEKELTTSEKMDKARWTPQTIVFLLAGIINFFGYPYFLSILIDLIKPDLILPRFDGWLRIVVGFMSVIFHFASIYFSFFLPLAFGLLLTKSEYAFFRIVGSFLVGVGAGWLFRLALSFVGILNPY